MQPNDMERNFRDKLKSHTPAWDKAKNWDAIEARLPEKKKRRKGWIIWLFLALLTGAFAWWNLSDHPAGLPEQQTEEPVATDSHTGNETVAGKTVHSEMQQSGTAEENRSGSLQPENTLSPQDQASAGSPPKIPNPLPGHATVPPVNSLVSSVLPVEIVPFEQETGQILEVGSRMGGEAAPVERESGAGSIAALPVAPGYLTLSERAVDPLSLPEEGGVAVRKNRPRLGFEVYGDVSYPVRRYRALTPEQEAYVDARRSQEQVLESVEAGMLFSLRFQGGWSMSAGLAYQRINEKFRWGNVQTETFPVYSDSAYFYLDAQDEPQYVGGTIEGTRRSTRRVTNFNTYTFFNVPVIAGYEKRFQGFSLRATGGVVLQFYRGFEGAIPDENGGMLTETAVRQSDLYTSKTGLGLQAGFELSRSAGKWGAVFLGLSCRHGLTSLTANGTGYEQRYSTIGTRVGWRF